MNTKTYAETKSKAYVLLRKLVFSGENNSPKILIYKNAGGCYEYKELKKGESICFSEVKGIVYITSMGDITTTVSRETISKMIEETGVNLIFLKFA